MTIIVPSVSLSTFTKISNSQTACSVFSSLKLQQTCSCLCGALQNATAALHYCVVSYLLSRQRWPKSGSETVYVLLSLLLSSQTRPQSGHVAVPCSSKSHIQKLMFFFLFCFYLPSRFHPQKISENGTCSAFFQNPRCRGHVCASLFECHGISMLCCVSQTLLKIFPIFQPRSSLRVWPLAKNNPLSVILTVSAVSKISASGRYVVWLLFSGLSNITSYSAYSVGLSSTLCRKRQMSQLIAVPPLSGYGTKVFI